MKKLIRQLIVLMRKFLSLSSVIEAMTLTYLMEQKSSVQMSSLESIYQQLRLHYVRHGAVKALKFSSYDQ